MDIGIDSQGKLVQRPKETRTADGKTDRDWVIVGIAQQIGLSVALPIAGGALLGKYIDGVKDTYPRYTLGMLLIGVFVSVIGFIGIIRDIIKQGRN